MINNPCDTIAKWNSRYRECDIESVAPIDFLQRFSYLLPTCKNQKAVDYAAGVGANSIFLAKRGYEVDSFDISDIAVNKLKEYKKKYKLKINPQCVDLSTHKVKKNYYNLAIVTFFMQRELIHTIIKSLKKNGLIFYKTVCNNNWMPRRFLSHPDFVLQPNELLKLFVDFHIIYYNEDETDSNACIIARKINEL
jgi:tellurite methyltransferase